MSKDCKVEDSQLVSLKEELEFWGNNCGGCETCSMTFGGKSQPQFDLQELHMIVTELIDRRSKDSKE